VSETFTEVNGSEEKVAEEGEQDQERFIIMEDALGGSIPSIVSVIGKFVTDDILNKQKKT